MHSPKRLLLALLSTLLLLHAASNALAQEQTGIHVTGTGTVYGEPDLASFDAGINVVNTDVTAATTEAAEVAEAIITALLNAGVSDADIRTGSFSVWREDRHNQDGEPLAPAFRVMNTLHVTVREADQTGELLGLVLESGANQVTGVSYTFANPTELRAKARALAMQSARATAEQLASLGSTTLGAPTFIEELRSAGSNDRDSMAFAAESASRSMPVSGGELAVTVSVNIRFEIIPAD